jgi:hypothetical protein
VGGVADVFNAQADSDEADGNTSDEADGNTSRPQPGFSGCIVQDILVL